MLVRQPLLQRRWQQQLLVGFVGKVGLAHQRLPATGLGPSYPQTLANPCFSDGLLVERYLAGLTFPQRVWTSLLTFSNELVFDASTGELRITFPGAFKGRFVGNFVNPGQGTWIFVNDPAATSTNPAFMTPVLE